MPLSKGGSGSPARHVRNSGSLVLWVFHHPPSSSSSFSISVQADINLPYMDIWQCVCVCEGCPIKFGNSHHRLRIRGKPAASSMQKGSVLILLNTSFLSAKALQFFPSKYTKKKKNGKTNYNQQKSSSRSPLELPLKSLLAERKRKHDFQLSQGDMQSAGRLFRSHSSTCQPKSFDF